MKRFLLALVLAACTAHGRMHVGASSDVSGSASSTSEPTPEPAPPPPAPEKSSAAPVAAPAPAAPPPARPAGCELVCKDAEHNRVSKEASAAIGQALAGELASLEECAQGRNPASVVLRFDSTSALTHFGVDDEHGGPCVDSVRAKWPSVTYQGPATLRCAEHCKR